MNITNLIRYATLMLVIAISSSCANGQKKKEVTPEYLYTNALINESSPYLLQHSHNPVNWYPWGDEAFQKAKKEDKLVLISIGYSSCHWCHVMEHESFEDTLIAKIMNDNFICIKVDREERPDVDQIYMSAVQLMTGRGGWPLNCFALPDGRPVYGGTYYPKNDWEVLLNDLSTTYQRDKGKFETYAKNLTEGIKESELIKSPVENTGIDNTILEKYYTAWESSFDYKEGGANRSPKFPLPNNFKYLMSYAHLSQNEELMDYVDLTLHKMALGGIYDQVGGGFARYSTDVKWKVPHFEKMLYDNGQLVGLYSQAYQRTKSDLYKHTVYQTIDWLEREMTTSEGAFLSALDADSEGEEGKFYVWSKEELKSLLTSAEYEFTKTYYNVGPKGAWEGHFILLKDLKDTNYASVNGLTNEELKAQVDDINSKLLTARSKRIRPGIDDKALTSWNALMLHGLVEASMAFNEPRFKALALKNAKWILKYQLKKDGSLFHTYKDGESKIDGFLDDYAFTITAFIKLYEVTFDEKWLQHAKKMADYAVSNFKDKNSGMFYFTSSSSQVLIARKMEVNDNVIPSSNSEMAKALHTLGSLLDINEYKTMATQMLLNVQADMAGYPSGYSNWALVHLQMSKPYYEVAITGKEWTEKVSELNKHYIPNKVIMGGEDGDIPLLEGKFIGETTIFVCVDRACQMPVTKVEDAIQQMKNYK